MAQPSYDEMEAKRQEMIASFKDIAAAMTRCVAIIDDYTRLSPTDLVPNATFLQNLAIEAEGGKKERKKRAVKPKDPNAPKRPPSAYILFQNEVREEMRKINPDRPYKEILGVIASKWKEMPELDKKVYEEAYQSANDQWRQDDEIYKKTGAPVPIAAAAPGASEGDSDDSDSSSGDDSPVLPAALGKKPVLPVTAPLAATAPFGVPGTLAAAAAPQPEVKKEKKRKTKEDEAAVNSALGTIEKKKKKVKAPTA